MALVYQTGRDLTLTINSVTYTDVAAGATLAVEENQFTGEVISGRITKHIDRSATLSVELYQDWSSTSPASVCKALWSAAATAPNTGLTFVLGCSGITITGKVFPNFPEMGGNATDALTTSVSMVVDFTGANTLTIA
jgi:hypothetical protein